MGVVLDLTVTAMCRAKTPGFILIKEKADAYLAAVFAVLSLSACAADPTPKACNRALFLSILLTSITAVDHK